MIHFRYSPCRHGVAKGSLSQRLIREFAEAGSKMGRASGVQGPPLQILQPASPLAGLVLFPYLGEALDQRFDRYAQIAFVDAAMHVALFRFLDGSFVPRLGLFVLSRVREAVAYLVQAEAQ